MKRHLPLLAFITIVLLGGLGSALVWQANQRAERIRFAALADEAVSRIVEQVSRHILLIEATAAMFEAQQGRVAALDFDRYYEQLRLSERNPGIAGLGYAAFVRKADLPSVQAAFAERTGGTLELFPPTDSDLAAPLLIIGSPDPQAVAATGYDMFSEPRRRAAMEAAVQAGSPRATAPLWLATDDIEAPLGFIVYAPVYGGGFGLPPGELGARRPTGFAFGGFRVAELISAALNVSPLLPVNLEVLRPVENPALATGAPAEAAVPPVVARYGAEPSGMFGGRYDESRQLAVAGQQWILQVRPAAGFRPSGPWALTGLLLAVTLALAAAIALSLRDQARSRAAAEALAETQLQNLAEKDLLLQEMKHRIKNAIARILAMARQTAATTADKAAFTETFTSRLQAMASAQDMLTRSAWRRADLRELLMTELTQVLGDAVAASRVEGVPVEIDERTTQALGLTFHELATNALKYGGAARCMPGLAVAWTVVPAAAGGRTLVIDWRETGGTGMTAPDTTGFGSRLIEANVRHELGGNVERTFHPDGLHLRLTVPLAEGGTARDASLASPDRRAAG